MSLAFSPTVRRQRRDDRSEHAYAGSGSCQSYPLPAGWAKQSESASLDEFRWLRNLTALNAVRNNRHVGDSPLPTPSPPEFFLKFGDFSGS